jgi:hypothetical protein
MAVPSNSITLDHDYVGALDDVYAAEILTGDLTVNQMRVKPTGRSGSFLVQMLALVGAGDYSRATGHPGGNATLTWEEKTYSQDRGRYFTLDSMDAEEAQIDAYTIGGEFVRTKMVAEVDAYRFATLATAAGTDASAVFSTAAEVLAAWDVALAKLGDAEVPQERLIAYIAWSPYTLLKGAVTGTRLVTEGTDLNREITRFDGIKIVKVPMTRFHMGITCDAGATAGAGGYTNTGVGINFMIVDKAAVFCDLKHGKQRLFSPEVNQTGDQWRLDYRAYHDAFLWDNKASGVYVHTSTS